MFNFIKNRHYFIYKAGNAGYLFNLFGEILNVKLLKNLKISKKKGIINPELKVSNSEFKYLCNY